MIETITAFARSDNGFYLGAALLAAGVFAFCAVKWVIAPRLAGELQGSYSREKAQQLQILRGVALFDLVAFGGCGAALLYLHYSG